MPPKKPSTKPPTRRIELEPEEPEVYEPDEEIITPAPTPKINMTMEKKNTAGRPSGTKDTKPRKMTMSKLEALAKAQAVRKANIEKRKKEQLKIEPEQAEIDSVDEIIEKLPEKKQIKEKEESIKTYKSEPKKPKRKIVIVKEPQTDSDDESVEIKYIKPKNKSKQRNREPIYDDYDDYEEKPKQRQENALDLLLKHYGGF